MNACGDACEVMQTANRTLRLACQGSAGPDSRYDTFQRICAGKRRCERASAGTLLGENVPGLI